MQKVPPDRLRVGRGVLNILTVLLPNPIVPVPVDPLIESVRERTKIFAIPPQNGTNIRSRKKLECRLGIIVARATNACTPKTSHDNLEFGQILILQPLFDNIPWVHRIVLQVFLVESRLDASDSFHDCLAVGLAGSGWL